MTMSLTRDQARALIDTVLSFSKAEACEVEVRREQDAHTRFAANDVTTAGSVRNLLISIQSGDGQRTGNSVAHSTEPKVLREAVAQSEQRMAAARPNPEYVDDLGPQDYPEIAAFDDSTAAGGSSARARREGVAAALAEARTKELDAAGFFSSSAT
jgi:hypothetical protein